MRFWTSRHLRRCRGEITGYAALREFVVRSRVLGSPTSAKGTIERSGEEQLLCREMPCCPECAFLRVKHADAALTHNELRDQLRSAAQISNGDLMALIVSEAAALKNRDSAEAALRRHQAIAHGRGDARGATV